jgi:uncharacterized protein
MTANDDPPAANPADPPKTRRCPICGKPRSARYDPFCSRRCADVDLHRWLKGAYVIPGAEPPREPGGEDE